jgi:hypothetical protein
MKAAVSNDRGFFSPRRRLAQALRGTGLAVDRTPLET